MLPRLLPALLATVLALLALLGTDGRWRLAVDPSPAAFGGGGGRDTLILSLQAPAGRLGADEIRLAEALTAELRALPGVRRVHSVATVELPHAAGGEIDIATLAARIRREPPRAAYWIERAAEDPLIRNRLVSADGRAMLLNIELSGEHEREVMATARRLREHIGDALAGHPQVGWAMTGAPLISAAIGDMLVREMIVVLPAAIALCALLLWGAFRRLGVVLACLLAVAAAVLWTLGAAAALGWKLNLVTILIPPLVTTLAVAYSMHVIAAFADHGDIDAGMRIVRLPLAITALTTMIGLAALAVNSLWSIRQFALLGAVGAAAAALSAMTLLPALLAWQQQPPMLWPPVNSWLMRRGRAMANFAVDHSGLVTGVGIGVFVLALIGAARVEPGARFVRDLSPDHPERLAFETLERQFGGVNGFSITIRGQGADAVLEPAALRAVAELQDWLTSRPEVSSVLSLVDYLQRIHQVFADDAPEAYRLPDSQAAARQLLAIAGPPSIAGYTNLDFSRLVIDVRLPVVDSGRLRSLFDRLDQRLQMLPPELAADLAGPAVDLSRTVDRLAGGQLRSISIAALAIFCVLAVLFASPRVALRAMLPNLLPIAVYFGVLGFSGIQLGPSMALVACIVLGVAVDDTLHLLVRFNDLARRYADEERAARDAVAEVIRPITLTTLAVSAGFLILVTSPFQSQVVFGLLAAGTLVVAWLSDLLLTPAISARASIVTLWDVVRLDLGESPQQTIPLMAGMSARQARVLALNARILSVAPGETLIRQGDEGREMYVIIDGELRIWMPRRDGEDLSLAVCGRGTTIGEGGYFNQRRSASVTAVTPARVMVFDPETLERIRRRSPRLGALAYRNLNRIQAQHMAGTTSRLAEATVR